MIHLLQTGDLHLGKIFYGFSLIEDQKFMLNQLIKTVSEAKKQNPYQAVIITGDIYDRSVPPTEAIELFDEFLIELHQIDKDLKILLIPGNHDSAGRLSFGTRFLESQNIFICTNPENIENPVFIEGNEFSSNKNDGIYFYQIPFLSSGSLFSKDKNQRLTTQEELINEAISRIKIFHENSKYKNLPMGLNAHLFTLGGTSCDSERHFIGNAELINKNVFEDFSYVALGHLHKKQKVSENIFYAGSPLAYSFDEANLEKSFLDITIDFSKETSKVETKEIEINPLHKVTKLSGKFEEFIDYAKNENSEFYKFKNDFLEITCTDEILVENPVARLRDIFPNILSVKQEVIIKNQNKISNTEKKLLLNNEQNFNSEKIFMEFVKDVENVEDENEWESTKKLFCKIEKTICKDE